MPHPFALHVPADDRYRVLAPEIAGKYVELVGGSAGDGKAFADALVRALGRVVNGSADAVDLTFELSAGGVEVTVRCGDRSTVVRHKLSKR
ncbi:MAG: hypothetical protein ACHQO8_00795 [Vicinamibacterales bacterium]